MLVFNIGGSNNSVIYSVYAMSYGDLGVCAILMAKFSHDMDDHQSPGNILAIEQECMYERLLCFKPVSPCVKHFLHGTAGGGFVCLQN
jgi:hypothetical protein